jgi:hypothetical protein
VEDGNDQLVEMSRRRVSIDSNHGHNA